MSKVTPARRAACSVLAEAARRDAYVRELLDSSETVAHLERREAAFARRLALGATTTVGCLDEVLDRYLAKPKKVAPRVRAALRIAAFELLYLDAAPEVAVSQGVELVRAQMSAAAGMANAVLRRVARTRAAYLAGEDAAEVERAAVSRARRAGLPVWLARAIEASLGEDVAAELFAAQLEPAPIAAYWKGGAAPCWDMAPSEAGTDACGGQGEAFGEAGASGQAELDGRRKQVDVYREGAVLAREKGIDQKGGEACVASSASNRAYGTLRVESIRDLIATGALARGEAVVSDANAQEVALLATRPGSCLEIGAGRGTKTYIMAAEAARRGYRREHVALDLYEGKCRQNRERLERAGLDAGVRFVAGDATDLAAVLGEDTLFDTVLLDAPCSGTGTMRRHPEIPWRLAPEDVREGLPKLQLALLKQAAGRVKPGGSLIYATCSVLAQENDGAVDAFLATPEGRRFTLSRRHQTHPAPGGFDGHFFAEFSCG